MKSKIISIIIILTISIFLILPLVNGAVLVNSYPYGITDGSKDFYLIDNYPNGGGLTAQGMSFKSELSNNTKVTTLTVDLCYGNTTNTIQGWIFNLTAYIFTHGGTYGTNSYPTNTTNPIGISNVMTQTDFNTFMSTTPNSFHQVTFTFESANAPTLTYNVNYTWAVCMTYTNAPGSGQNNLALGHSQTATYSGNHFEKAGANWGGLAYDCPFLLQGDIVTSPLQQSSLNDVYNIIDAETYEGLTPYNFTSDLHGGYTDYNLTQGRTYQYSGQIWNYSSAYGVTGNFTAKFTSVMLGYADSLNNQTGTPLATSYSRAYTLMYGYNYNNSATITGNITNGWILFNFTTPIVYGSAFTHFGFFINYSIIGEDVNWAQHYEGYLSHSIMFTSEDTYYTTNNNLNFYTILTGDIFTHATIARAPTQITLKQGITYSVENNIYNNSALYGNGTYTVYTTQLSSTVTVFSNPIYVNNASGSITNGNFTFSILSVQLPNTVYQSLKIVFTLDSGGTGTYIFNFGYYKLGSSVYPTPTPTNGNSGNIETGSMVISPLLWVGIMITIIFTCVFGAIAGRDGLLAGLMFGMFISTLANIFPIFTYILIVIIGALLVFSHTGIPQVTGSGGKTT